jgi:eukaryotic-like serine/threonine-protein kinase
LAGRGDTKKLAAQYAAEQALRGFAMQDCKRAKAAAIQGLKTAGGRAATPRAALALALCGASNQVKLLIGELSGHYPVDTLINSLWLPTIRGALQFQRGRAAQAIEQLQPTASYEAAAEFWPQYVRGLTYLKLGRRGSR